MIKDQALYIEGADAVLRDDARIGADEYGPIEAIKSDATMRSPHQVGIERDDVHQRALAKPALRQAGTNSQSWKANGWIDEQLHGIVTRLAMDLHRACEIWGKC